MSRKMRYVISVHVENYNMEHLRAFEESADARGYVEKLAARLAKRYTHSKRCMFVTSATLYEVTRTGRLHIAAEFDGDEEGGDWRDIDDAPPQASA
jgi:hypothetical protein